MFLTIPNHAAILRGSARTDGDTSARPLQLELRNQLFDVTLIEIVYQPFDTHQRTRPRSIHVDQRRAISYPSASRCVSEHESAALVQWSVSVSSDCNTLVDDVSRLDLGPHAQT